MIQLAQEITVRMQARSGVNQVMLRFTRFDL